MSKKREGSRALASTKQRGGPPSKRQKGGGGGGGKGGGGNGNGKPHAKRPAPNKLRAEIPLAGSNGDDDGDEASLSEEDAEFVREHAASVGFLANLDERALGAAVLSRQAAEAAAQARREQARQQRQRLGAAEAPKRGDGGGNKDDSEEGGEADSEAEADYERLPRGSSAAKQAARGGPWVAPGQKGQRDDNGDDDDDDEGPALPVKGPDGRLVFLKGNEQQRRRQQLRLLAGSDAAGADGAGPTAAATNPPTATATAAASPSPAVVRAADILHGSVPGVLVTDALDEEEAAAREEAKRREAERRAEAARRAASEAARRRAAATHPGLAIVAAAPDRLSRREAARTQLALAATQALAAEASADPPPAAALGSALRLLNALAADRDGYVARLAQISLLAVLRDVAPGYRIRADDAASGGGGKDDGAQAGGGSGPGNPGGGGGLPQAAVVVVSKEVQRLRDYEGALLKGYQAYLKTLLAAADRGEERVRLPPVYVPPRANRGEEDDDGDEDDDEAEAAAAAIAAAAAAAAELEARRAGARVAVRCMSGLLTSLPHFNYASDLLRALVARMASRDPDARAAATAAVGATARAYAAGGSLSRLALEAVQLVADLVRRRRCVCPPETVSCLLDVRLEAAAAKAAAMRGDDERDLSAAEINRRRQRGRRAANASRKQNLRDKRKGKASAAAAAAAAAQDGVGGRGGGRAAAMQKAVREAGDAAVLGLGRDLAEGDVHDARGAAEAARVQSRMVEAMFEIFFRVLKHCAAALKASAATAAAAAAAASAAPADGGGGKAGNGGGSKGGSGSGANGANSDANSRADLQAEWPAGRVALKFPLLAPCLQGIARHAHLLSVEYLTDLGAALQSLLDPVPPSAPSSSSGVGGAGGCALPLRERLHALDCAARALLRGQGEALLAVDRRGLLRALYAALLMVPCQPLHDSDFFVAALSSTGGGGGGGGGASLPPLPPLPATADEERAEADADARAAVAARLHAAGGSSSSIGGTDSGNNSNRSPTHTTPDALPTPVLLVRVCEQFLLEGSRTAVDAPTLAAFAKRLCTVALAASSPAESVALCSLVVRLVRRHPRLSALLEWGEDAGAVPVGGRPYDPCCGEPADAGALGAALWELPALASRHWHPHAAGAARQALASLAPGAAAGGGAAAASGPLVAAMSPQELAAAYDVLRTGRFKPAPHLPSLRRGAAGGGGGAAAAAAGAASASPAKQRFVVQGQEARRLAAAAAVEGAGLCDDLGAAMRRVLPLVNGTQEEDGGRAREASSELAAVAAAAEGVARHVAARRRSARNAALRRERASLERRVALFREHLIEAKARERSGGKKRLDGGVDKKKEKKKSSSSSKRAD